MKNVVLLVVVAVLVVAASAAGYLFAQRGDDEATTTNVCANPIDGYVVEFPEGWHVGGTAEDPGRSELVCAFFDPDPFQIPARALESGFRRALEVRVPGGTFEQALASVTDPSAVRTIDRSKASVASRRAVRLELEATGRGRLAEGTRSYGYLIDRRSLPPFDDVGLPPLLVRTTAPPGDELRKDVVDHAVQTLRLLPPTIPEPLAGVPDAVVRKHFQILAAAEARDYETLAQLAAEREFTYTFGGPVAGGPAQYWRRLERRGDADPAGALAAILRLPYTLQRGVYVWPFAYDTPADELTTHERELLGPLARSYAGDSYLGWRAGIEPDGDWIFFIAGD